MEKEKGKIIFRCIFICTVFYRHDYLEHNGYIVKLLLLSYNHNSMFLILAKCAIG